MAEYIEREALLEAFDNADADVVEDYGDGTCEWGFGRKNILEVINRVPAADVAPVRHGLWECDEWGSYLRRCSVCKKSPVYQDERGNSVAVYAGVCINCGAKMDGGESQGMKR